MAGGRTLGQIKGGGKAAIERQSYRITEEFTPERRAYSSSALVLAYLRSLALRALNRHLRYDGLSRRSQHSAIWGEFGVGRQSIDSKEARVHCIRKPPGTSGGKSKHRKTSE
jgi:hypothetical protein